MTMHQGFIHAPRSFPIEKVAGVARSAAAFRKTSPKARRQMKGRVRIIHNGYYSIIRDTSKQVKQVPPERGSPKI
jgi:hypothetical protein